MDPCRPNPCLNSGACVHTDDGFVCNCSMGFKGTHCQGLYIFSDDSIMHKINRYANILKNSDYLINL